MHLKVLTSHQKDRRVIPLQSFPHLHPLHPLHLFLLLPSVDPYDAFEGLRAEECGILNGCENGRCVRVQEGYTCDCFDGYTLDMSRMACIGKLLLHYG